MENNISYEYSDRAITPWGGLRWMKELLDKTGIRKELGSLPLPVRGSNRGFSSVQLMESFWVSVWMGASRMTHAGWLRYDRVIGEIFQWKRIPSESTLSRFFHKFTWRRNTEVFVPLQRWFMKQLTIERITLDVDSTVITRYGAQEGSRKGFNIHKPGRPSHHPLMAFIPELRIVANAWLRPGNTASASSLHNFLEETFGILGEKKIGLLRGDSGFYGDKYLRFFEERKVHYIVSTKVHPPLKWEIWSCKNWLPVAQGIQVSEFMYKAVGWKILRRMIVVRQEISQRPKATGKMLFSDDELGARYRYSCMVTDLDLSPMQVWALYRQRADAENRIKELKYDFAIDGFCLKNFWATEAAFRSIMVAYNLMSLFRFLVLQTKTQSTLTTMRFKCFALGAWVSRHAGKKVLKLSVSGKKRLWLDGLFATINDLEPPFQCSNA